MQHAREKKKKIRGVVGGVGGKEKVFECNVLLLSYSGCQSDSVTDYVRELCN